MGINFAPEPSGIAPYTTRIAAGLRERGHSVQVVSPFPHYPHWTLPDDVTWSRTEVVDGNPVKRVRHYVPANPGSNVHRALSEASFGVRLLTSRWGSPDVVICPSPALVSTRIAMMRLRGRRRPAFGVIVQDLYSAGASEGVGSGGGRTERMLARLEGTVLRHADGVSVIHDRFKDRVVSTLDVDPGRVSVIRNWTHVSPAPQFDRDAFRAWLGWRPDEVIVLHAGAMGEKQALGNVVDAAKLAESTGKRVRFVLLGNGGQREALERLAGGCTAIEFRDPLPGDDYVKAMASADVLLVNEKPGVVEMAVPSKLTSYFSSGRPVLAASESASITAAEVRASGAGVVVAPGEPDALVNGALALGEDRHSAAEMGARGADYCQTHLTELAALGAYDAWVRQLHARRQGNQ